MKKKRRGTPPYEHYPSWTTAKFFGFVRSNLRMASQKYPARNEALKASIVGRMINKKTGRLANHHKCASCGNIFVSKEVQADHIIPAGSLRSFEDLPGFVERLFCSVEGFQILCKTCHKSKTHNK